MRIAYIRILTKLLREYEEIDDETAAVLGSATRTDFLVAGDGEPGSVFLRCVQTYSAEPGASYPSLDFVERVLIEKNPTGDIERLGAVVGRAWAAETTPSLFVKKEVSK
jgi:hypothetical protein